LIAPPSPGHCRIATDLRLRDRMVLPAAAPLARLQLWPLRR